ncbi:SpoIIE family protein phosphatase [Parvicella tangerina]|uniref:PPM-type phosphatase domain-containing protein n=1 Tax=Parvicella tangerina TaxID=2829795 RepID=A0A916JJI3_9FLAO|nr:SpoIIE family protein phosphatase [Parvicella tangerina]CAG5077405.1 hypothetical protein CRYO30217_00374 [Parvicella tangerina]
MKLRWTLLFLLGFSNVFIAQHATSNKLDSIYGQVEEGLDDKQLVTTLLGHVVNLRSSDDLTSAKVILDSVHNIAKTNKSLQFEYAKSLMDAAIIAKLEGNEESMVNNYQSAIDAYQSYKGYAPDSMIPKIEIQIAKCNNNVAQVFLAKEDYGIALDIYKGIVESIRDFGDTVFLSICYYNIAETFNEMENYDSAFHYMMISKKLEQQLNSDEGLAYAHDGLARIYNKEANYLKALQHLDSAQEFCEKIGDEFFRLNLISQRSEILEEIGGLSEAIEILELGLIKASQIGYKDFEVRTAKKLSELYEKVENYEKAFFYQGKYKDYLIQANNEETNKIVEEFKVQYESEQKDKEIEQLALQNKLKEEANKNLLEKRKAEASKTRIVYWSLGGGILMLLIIGLLLFIDSRRRKRINQFLKTNNESLARKNEQILHQSKLIGDSINYAQNIQRAILPTTVEMNDSFEDHFVFFLPKDVVSGDFYWMHKIPDSNKVLFSVADCTGHGVPGAFMSIVGHALLEKIAKQLNIYSPSKILNRLAFELQNTLKKGEGAVDDGMDIALVMVDYDSKTVHFAGARNPLVIISDNELTLLKGDRIDLGKQSEVDFQEATINFNKGDKLYMFTDGFPDQKGGEHGKKYYAIKLRHFFQQVSNESMSNQMALLRSEFECWKGTKEQVDDVLIVGVRL